MVVGDYKGTTSAAQASNGAIDPRLAALTTDDQHLVWTVATLMLDTTNAFGDTVSRFLTEKLPQLPRDEDMVKALAGHAAADAKEVLSTLRAGMDPSAHETPVEALQHARYLRQRGVGLNTLIQVYQYGFAMFRELVVLEFRERAIDPGQVSRLTAAVDAYAFPFVGTTMQRLAYEFGSTSDGWTPHAGEEVLSDPESLGAARSLREERIARGAWVAAAPEDASARREAERVLDEFSTMLQSGVRDKGLHDRLALAATTVTLTLADESDLSITLLLDRSPIEVVDGFADAESQIWIASVDVPRIWSSDYHLPMAIAKGRIKIAGPVRKFLRIVPILRTVGESPSDVAADSY